MVITQTFAVEDYLKCSSQLCPNVALFTTTAPAAAAAGPVEVLPVCARIYFHSNSPLSVC